MSTKKSKEEIVHTKEGTMRVEWASNNKPRMRRIDQKQIDKYLLSGKVNHSQHQAANWYFNLVSTAQATPHLVSQMGKLNVGKGKPIITNKQAVARVVMGKVEDYIEASVGKDCMSVMRNVIVYDESMREQQRKYGGRVRTEGLSMLRDALDALDKFMCKNARYI